MRRPYTKAWEKLAHSFVEPDSAHALFLNYCSRSYRHAGINGSKIRVLLHEVTVMHRSHTSREVDKLRASILAEVIKRDFLEEILKTSQKER